jgi:FtsP/CotA-like multicopper oxidase with cupredoxin domain
MRDHHADVGDVFPQDPTGLAEAQSPTEVALEDGSVLDLRIAPVRKRIGAATVRMLAYSRSIPGPVLRVRRGTTVTVHVTNDADLEQTVHWHGLRLENRFDGVPHETQEPIPVGGRFTYELTFPDAGLYWYHPHVREDYGQEMGLYGHIIVEPDTPDYWPPCDHELALTLDDLLIEHGRVAPFQRSGATHTMMGRFGNVLLVNGQTDAAFDAPLGQVIRLLLTNTANTRIFNVALPGARMKLIGGDSGRYEHERFVDSVVLAPSERAVVDVLIETPGPSILEHRTPDRVYPLAVLNTTEGDVRSVAAETFATLRHAPELAAERERSAAHRDREPDKTLRFVGEMDMGGMHHDMDMTHDTGMGQGEAGVADHTDDGIEWEDTMAEMNAMSDRSNMTWQLIDADTGAVNHDIFWTFKVGDRIKVRLDNSTGSDHDMHHPFHIHGAGRFLVLDRDGVADDNLVWKDTVLVRAGEIVNILFEASNPGRWMAHCHIAEHAESGMMFNFDVLRNGGSPG